MMVIQRHPNDDTLVRRAAGTLDPRLAYVVDVHLGVCRQCRERYRLARELGGQVLEGVQDPQMDDSPVDVAWASMLTRLDSVDRPPVGGGEDDVAQHPGGIPPARLRDRVDAGLDWRRLAPGIEQFVLMRQPAGGWVRLFRFQPGTCVPMHAHAAEEFSTVLQGSYVDETGHYGVGDFSEMTREDSHRPVVDSDVPCVALIATSGLTRFHNPLIRPLARWLSI